MPTYEKGQLVRVTGEFQDTSGAYVDPTTVKFDFKVGTGAVTTYTYPTDTQLVKDATGKYHVDISASAVGTVYYRFYSTGANQAANEDSFDVASPGGF